MVITTNYDLRENIAIAEFVRNLNSSAESCLMKFCDSCSFYRAAFLFGKP